MVVFEFLLRLFRHGGQATFRDDLNLISACHERKCSGRMLWNGGASMESMESLASMETIGLLEIRDIYGIHGIFIESSYARDSIDCIAPGF